MRRKKKSAGTHLKHFPDIYPMDEEGGGQFAITVCDYLPH